MTKQTKITLWLTGLIAAFFLLTAFAPVLSQSANAIICRFEATPCETVWNGNHDIFYRDAGGTETIRMDGDGSVRVAVPTQAGTTTPGVIIKAGANSNAFEIRNAAETPIFQVGSTGGIVASGILTQGATLDSLTVSGASALNGGLTMDTTAFSVADTSGNTSVGGTLGVTGATDLASTLQYGTDNLYPLGYASVNQQLVCGTTSAFTATTQITPSGLTTPTYVIVSQVTQPAATIAFLTAQDPTTTTFEIYSWGADYNAGTTGVVAHWCAVGDQ